MQLNHFESSLSVFKLNKFINAHSVSCIFAPFLDSEVWPSLVPPENLFIGWRAGFDANANCTQKLFLWLWCLIGDPCQIVILLESALWLGNSALAIWNTVCPSVHSTNRSTKLNQLALNLLT